MLSYPTSNNVIHHPNIYTLIQVANDISSTISSTTTKEEEEENDTSYKIDVRLLVVHREPTTQLVSLSINREFLPLDLESIQMSVRKSKEGKIGT